MATGEETCAPGHVNQAAVLTLALLSLLLWTLVPQALDS